MYSFSLPQSRSIIFTNLGICLLALTAIEQERGGGIVVVIVKFCLNWTVGVMVSSKKG